jgi:hypothetical protein
MRFVKGNYLILMTALFVGVCLVTAILIAWPVASYLASESFG